MKETITENWNIFKQFLSEIITYLETQTKSDNIDVRFFAKATLFYHENRKREIDDTVTQISKHVDDHIRKLENLQHENIVIRVEQKIGTFNFETLKTSFSKLNEQRQNEEYGNEYSSLENIMSVIAGSRKLLRKRKSHRHNRVLSSSRFRRRKNKI